ncbi:MAG: hypothetical protein FJX45_11485 [Alphaproteobacteria bacterium]|nr:hypothetical protein [Alphaproteobacteria bacterium]
MRPRSNPLAAYLTPEAETLLARVGNRHDRCHLVGFLGHACSRGRPLGELNGYDLAAYEAALIDQKVARPKQAARDAAHAWNRMAARPGWPGGPITPKSNIRHSTLSFGKLPLSLRKDISCYLTKQSEEDVFGDPGAKALASATLKDRRGKICQLVTLAVAAGVDLSSLRSLKGVVKEPIVRAILEALWVRSNHKANAHAANLARLLRLIAKHHAGAPQAVLALINRAESRLRPGKQGMTDRNRKKLRRIVDDEETLHRLIQLPSEVAARVDRDTPSFADAIAIQTALAIQIVLMAPMRAKNLAGLDFKHHVDIINPACCHIVIEAADVKNDRDLEYSLGAGFMRLLTLYRDTYWPILAGDRQTSAVFISRNGRQKTPGALGVQIASFIKEHVGVDMHVHLFRHLAGYLFLRAHPGEYEPVRQLLGHKSIRTTVDFYVGLEQEHSFKRYDEILKSYSHEVEDVPA